MGRFHVPKEGSFIQTTSLVFINNRFSTWKTCL